MWPVKRERLRKTTEAKEKIWADKFMLQRKEMGPDDFYKDREQKRPDWLDVVLYDGDLCCLSNQRLTDGRCAQCGNRVVHEHGPRAGGGGGIGLSHHNDAPAKR